MYAKPSPRIPLVSGRKRPRTRTGLLQSGNIGYCAGVQTWQIQIIGCSLINTIPFKKDRETSTISVLSDDV